LAEVGGAVGAFSTRVLWTWSRLQPRTETRAKRSRETFIFKGKSSRTRIIQVSDLLT
jgi:hypothetical protein